MFGSKTKTLTRSKSGHVNVEGLKEPEKGEKGHNPKKAVVLHSSDSDLLIE